jgi:hypothetical protein
MEERNDDIAQTARETIEARRFQRDAYAASGGEAAVIYNSCATNSSSPSLSD